MRNIQSLKIALKFSKGRGNNLISFNSLISIISIIIGVAVLITGLSLMNGFKRELQNRVLSVIPHEEIESLDHPFINWRNLLKLIQCTPNVITATPYLKFNGLIKHGNKLKIIQIKAIDPISENKLNKLFSYIKNNLNLNLKSEKKQIILGKGIVEDLKIKLGDFVELIIPNQSIPYLKKKLFQPKHIFLKLSGVLELHNQFDRYLAIIPILDAQKYLNRIEDIDGIAVKTNDIFHSNKIILNIKDLLKYRLKIKSWTESYGYIYNDIKTIRLILYLTMLMVIIIACFSILSHLVKMVQNKNNDIAILITLGAENRFVIFIFIWYGLLTTLTGTIIGITLGILFVSNLNFFIKYLEIFFHHNFFLKNIYFIDFLPHELHILDIIYIIILSVFLGLLSSLYPAYRICKINPVKILNSK